MKSNTDSPAPDVYFVFADKLAVFLDKLACYLDDPDEAAIHDVRTSIRRLYAAYRVLPRDCKGKATRSYIQRCRAFFSLNSLIRDCDVIKEKLTDPAQLPPMPQEVIAHLDRTRIRELHRATALARELDELHPPRLEAAEEHSVGLRAERIHQRAVRFLVNLAFVQVDETNIEQLHELRKDAKKLFYLLEPDTRLLKLPQTASLRQVQRLAGLIHDCDITIDYLSHYLHAYPELSDFLARERQERHVSYEALCVLLESEDWQILERLQVEVDRARL